jgi:hypothetical protein
LNLSNPLKTEGQSRRTLLRGGKISAFEIASDPMAFLQTWREAGSRFSSGGARLVGREGVPAAGAREERDNGQHARVQCNVTLNRTDVV